MLRRTAIVCVLAAPVFGAETAAAALKHASKHGLTKQASKQRGATRACSGARRAAIDEASRRRASKAVMCLVNRKRRAHNVLALRRSKPLAEAALRHSAAMVRGKYFSHAGASGGVLTRAIRSGYVRGRRYRLLGETLSWGIGTGATPAQLVAAFMRSPAHRRTLLSKRFRDVGVGLARGAPTVNVTGNAATLTLAFGRR